MNHYSLDYNAKLSYYLSETSSIKLFAYNTFDEFRFPLYSEEAIPIVKWNNQIYKATYNGQWGKLGNTTSAYYSSHISRANADILGFGSYTDTEFDDETWDDEWDYDETQNDTYMPEDVNNEIRSGIKTATFNTEFNYSPENIYSTRWGFKYSNETYEMTALGNGNMRKQNETINQYSLYYDNFIRVTDKITTRVGVHFVAYNPVNYRNYYSIQPRFTLNFTPGKNNLLYMNFSKMEQFYHCLKLNYWDLPTDFRMPSIGDYKPRTSEHYESGWKHFLDNGLIEVSAYYKTRRNLVALRPETYVEDDQWQEYIMTGKGDSYGIRFYFNGAWERWRMQVSYSYARSREWFDELAENGKMSSLQDIPHQAGIAISYRLGLHSLISAGGMLHSGKILEMDENFDPFPVPEFRTHRSPLNYRVDAGYSYRKSFGDKLLSLRFGLYNIIGNPSEEEILSYYSVHWKGHCLPYGSISFKF